MGSLKSFFSFVFLIGMVPSAFAVQADTLLCGGTYHGRPLKFTYNPTGASFTYSGADPEDYFLIYVNYSAEKKDRLEITTMEFLKDETYEAFKEAVSKIPEMTYLRKPLIHKQVVSLYEGFVNYRVEQDDKVIAWSCVQKAKAQQSSPGRFGGYLNN
ncbi:MAG: hypothetical protein K2Q26_09420 [Bdellovibrionales bacterium]|nr:hypothetical protein [Bdellovibrionales bacterium]